MHVPVLGLDLDGVVFDFDRAWIDRHNREFGTAISYAQPQEWNGIITMSRFDSAPEFWGWWDRSGGWAEMPLYPGAEDAIQWVRRMGWYIRVVTNRPFSEDTIEACRKLGLHDVVHTSAKWDVHADIYVEDAPHNIAELSARTDRAVILRVERPWNRPDLHPEVRALPRVAPIPDFTPQHIAPWLMAWHWSQEH